MRLKIIDYRFWIKWHFKKRALGLCLQNSKFKIQNFKFRNKTSGSTLLVSVVLAGIMLTIGVLSARMTVREVEMSADLYLSEKAYFSAESGVEKSLWLLKNEPLAHVVPSDGDFSPELIQTAIEDEYTEVSIRNVIQSPTDDFHKDSFEFTLNSLESQKWRFRYDSDNTIATTEQPITGTLKIELDTAGSFFWRFLCQDSSGQTQALQATAPSTSSISDLLSLTGKTDDGVDETFNSWSSVDKSTCYISVQNLESDERTYTFSGTKMAPHAAHIHAVGRHQGREKHIRFDYAQKTLGPLFDFSFLHSEDGL